MTSEENRPSPDALLAEAQNEKRGKLKIFLGAAPGVGKTYAMLSAARARIAEGVDTVIGIVETHRRSETEALAAGIESAPRQSLIYRGLPFEEMDIDSIMQRKPALALIDELAHTNIPGARHRKRYQDVQEILDAGIDVYTTLNIQHVESLNDIVARITGVTVRETVPDTMIQGANAIELIDLPPEELLQRLKEGKVYIPEQARLAINRFFTPGNLTALRELALRQAAARVDDDMTSYMRRHAITGPWPTSSRIMVCISDDGQATALVRTARRSAERRQAPWMAMYVETSRHSAQSDSQRNEVAQALEIAENMGGETVAVASEDIAGEILRVARERNVSTIIIGKSVRSLWSRLARPSVAAAILDRGEGFDILLVSSSEAKRSGDRRAEPRDGRNWHLNWLSYGKGVLVIAIASVVAAAVSQAIGIEALPFIYLIAILLITYDVGLGPSIFATLLGGVALDLLMTAPDFDLLPVHSHDFVAILFFLAVGAAIGLIGDRMHRQVRATRRNAERTQALYDFTKSIAAAGTLGDVAQVTTRRVAAALDARAAILLPHYDRLDIAAAVPTDLRLDTASNAAMDWAWRHGKPAGFRSDTLPGAAFYGLPLMAGGAAVGVIAIKPERNTALTAEQNLFLSSLAYQAAAAIERARLATDVEQARLQSETEKLRANLLSSISRDLRGPLDQIISTSRNLHKRWNEIEPDQHQKLVISIEAEAERLDRFVQNLLDMTELVTGAVRLSRQPIAVQLLLSNVLAHLSRQTAGRTVRVDCPAVLPDLDGDPALLQRVLINVIENACAYSPPDQPIFITVQPRGAHLKITVTDHGPGIPESERERVFDMFYRIKSGAAQNASGGVGLGLSICRGFVEAHQGSIKAKPGDNGVGTSIVIRLPTVMTAKP